MDCKFHYKLSVAWTKRATGRANGVNGANAMPAQLVAQPGPFPMRLRLDGTLGQAALIVEARVSRALLSRGAYTDFSRAGALSTQKSRAACELCAETALSGIGLAKISKIISNIFYI